MNFLYDISLILLRLGLGLIALFNKKINLFLSGRASTFERLEKVIDKGDRTLWFHCASLGEFEQGRPVIEALSDRKPGYKVVLTFFSPSGYEVQKDYAYADVVVYLPLDTKKNVRKFLDIVQPSLAVFVKYEFWPNLLREIRSRQIPAYLISGVFRQDQVFFKGYGGWMRKALKAFTHFFVQNQESVSLLNGIGIQNVTLSGDTRFDRVQAILDQDNTLGFMDKLTSGKTCIVAGSTWPRDEELLIGFINDQKPGDVVYIIAPHQMDPERMRNLKRKIKKRSMLFSEGTPGEEVEVFIIDTIGLLTKIYSYASIAYVGGGFDRDGVHNVLEPAVFGVPVLIGPIFDKYAEAVELVERKGCLVTQNTPEFGKVLTSVLEDPDYREKTGNICSKYILESTGATQLIVDDLAQGI